MLSIKQPRGAAKRKALKERDEFNSNWRN